MTVLDELVYKAIPKYDYTGEYIGTEYIAHVEVKCRFFITKEAEVRELKEQSLKIAKRKCREHIKELYLKTAMELLQAEISSGTKGFPFHLVIVREADRIMLVTPPKMYAPLLKAFEKLEEEMMKKAFEEVAFHDT